MFPREDYAQKKGGAQLPTRSAQLVHCGQLLKHHQVQIKDDTYGIRLLWRENCHSAVIDFISVKVEKIMWVTIIILYATNEFYFDLCFFFVCKNMNNNETVDFTISRSMKFYKHQELTNMLCWKCYPLILLHYFSMIEWDYVSLTKLVVLTTYLVGPISKVIGPI